MRGNTRASKVTVIKVPWAGLLKPVARDLVDFLAEVVIAFVSVDVNSQDD